MFYKHYQQKHVYRVAQKDGCKKSKPPTFCYNCIKYYYNELKFAPHSAGEFYAPSPRYLNLYNNSASSPDKWQNSLQGCGMLLLQCFREVWHVIWHVRHSRPNQAWPSPWPPAIKSWKTPKRDPILYCLVIYDFCLGEDLFKMLCKFFQFPYLI